MNIWQAESLVVHDGRDQRLCGVSFLVYRQTV